MTKLSSLNSLTLFTQKTPRVDRKFTKEISLEKEIMYMHKSATGIGGWKLKINETVVPILAIKHQCGTLLTNSNGFL
ncbi:CLUMA_CG001345, isoform A [Clunio marinus]|uniref:CLUMA_CG001345, isoform A n=1 Tax=Clunio marinus TaxID=568069 RepID=A0A1J1HJG2_9DIPT|nr:CLUMA_CG001345, isoform A [Clunio marinus]